MTGPVWAGSQLGREPALTLACLTPSSAVVLAGLVHLLAEFCEPTLSLCCFLRLTPQLALSCPSLHTASRVTFSFSAVAWSSGSPVPWKNCPVLAQCPLPGTPQFSQLHLDLAVVPQGLCTCCSCCRGHSLLVLHACCPLSCEVSAQVLPTQRVLPKPLVSTTSRSVSLVCLKTFR